MILNSEPYQHLTPPYAGIPITQTIDYTGMCVYTSGIYNQHTDLWLQCDTSPSSSIHCHTHIVGLQITTLWIVLFTLTNESTPSTVSPTSGQQLVASGHPTLRPATCHAFNPSICCRPNCTSHTDVNSVVPTTVLSIAPTEAVLVNKPKPWTPIQPFILKYKLSGYTDKVFIELLIMTYAMVVPLAIMDHNFLLSKKFSVCFAAARSYWCHPC